MKDLAPSNETEGVVLKNGVNGSSVSGLESKMEVVANHGAAGLAIRRMVHVEVVQADRSNLPRSRVESLVDKFVRKTEYINTYLSITSNTNNVFLLFSNSDI